ncbi:hypothetical protein Btru_055607 [Bulinus truncatus]|nr:hypothetical protein Btru_055607 [Bulinus truncatus]
MTFTQQNINVTITLCNPKSILFNRCMTDETTDACIMLMSEIENNTYMVNTVVVNCSNVKSNPTYDCMFQKPLVPYHYNGSHHIAYAMCRRSSTSICSTGNNQFIINWPNELDFYQDEKITTEKIGSSIHFYSITKRNSTSLIDRNCMTQVITSESHYVITVSVSLGVSVTVVIMVLLILICKRNSEISRTESGIKVILGNKNAVNDNNYSHKSDSVDIAYVVQKLTNECNNDYTVVSPDTCNTDYTVVSLDTCNTDYARLGQHVRAFRHNYECFIPTIDPASKETACPGIQQPTCQDMLGCTLNQLMAISPPETSSLSVYNLAKIV